MGEKIFVGPFPKGLRNDVTPFNVDNDSFPVLENAQQWRGRIRRKRGTTQLGRLTRYFNSTSAAFNPGTTTQVLSGAGAGNLLTGFTSSGIETNASLVPGSVTITDVTTAEVYTDPSMDGTLSPGGSINYTTGAFTISPAAADTVNAQFKYYPSLPVLGEEDLVLSADEFPGTLAFDTTYSYNISTTFPHAIHSVSFYKNPASTTINSIAYTQKTTWTPVSWNGETYQQFWSTNYQGAFWVTNGIEVPFDPTNIGMQFKLCASVTYVSATQLTITITESSASLVIGDWVFINEVTGTDSNQLNQQTGFVTASANAAGTTTLTVRFPYATIQNQAYSAGILQYLTSRSDATKDCIRFYDGAPISNANPPVFSTGVGWVNFMPPLSEGAYSIADLPRAQYYLVGARMILSFKDRLIFIGPVIQTSTGVPKYLQDTVIYSQNGTPYYTASFQGALNPSTVVTTNFQPMLLPSNQTAQPVSFWEDSPGFGGFITAGYSQPINTVSSNEDVLIMGFSNKQARFYYTGNDIVPFNFFIINSELGSSSTFSAINFDQGIITTGSNGFISTDQTSCNRIDPEIPDEIFQFKLNSNGIQRVCAQRDYINEWVYFTYPSANDNSEYIYPTRTLLFNYRSKSWSLFKETYTNYGTFRRLTGNLWDDLTGFTWDEWTDPWDSGEQTLLKPEVISGNAQGFIMFRAEGCGEDPSGYIQSIDANSVVTSPDHCLNNKDYIVISGAIGTIAENINGKIFSVDNPSKNTFTLNPPVATGTYLGLGVFTRMYVPFIQTRQFPVSWSMTRKTRIGVQQYLFSKTSAGQIELQIYLSQNANNPYNSGPIVPGESTNNSLIYKDILSTSAEPNNLQMLGGADQAQIWHRMNTSLIGDTVQIGFTLSDEQMRDEDFNNQFVEIELHAFSLDCSPSQLLS